MRLIIDRDKSLDLRVGWSIRPEDRIASRATGKFAWDSSRVKEHLDTRQTSGRGWVLGTDLRLGLEGLEVERAQTLEQLYENPSFIPEGWSDGKARVAWGDIVCGSGGGLHVRYLIWRNGVWRLDWDYVDDRFDDRYPALLAS